MQMRPDQVAELEIMLDDYGLETVLETIADALERHATWVEKSYSWLEKSYSDSYYVPASVPVMVMRKRREALALRAQAQALAAGRALTYATQAPLGL